MDEGRGCGSSAYLPDSEVLKNVASAVNIQLTLEQLGIRGSNPPRPVCIYFLISPKLIAYC